MHKKKQKKHRFMCTSVYVQRRQTAHAQWMLTINYYCSMFSTETATDVLFANSLKKEQAVETKTATALKNYGKISVSSGTTSHCY